MENGEHHFGAGERFDVYFCHQDISLENDRKTAVVAVMDIDITRCVLGRNIYSCRRHNIYIRLDTVPDFSNSWIGMTNDSNPPLDNIHYQQGFSGWSLYSPAFINPDGEYGNVDDLGKPWITGDVIHLHLDCENHVLFAHHLRSCKFHAIHNIMGAQRLFIGMRELDTAMSIIL